MGSMDWLHNVEVEYFFLSLLIFEIFFICVAAWYSPEEHEEYERKKNHDLDRFNAKKPHESPMVKIYSFYRYFVDRIITLYLFQPIYWLPFSILLYLYLKENDWFVTRNDQILFITLMAVLWYGRETMIMRQAQENFNKESKEKKDGNSVHSHK